MGQRRSTLRRGARTGALALCVATCGCVETTTHHPVGAGEEHTLHRVPLVAAWDVVDDGRVIGAVLRFEREAAPDAEPELVFIVRNEHGQDLGLVDGLGRAWRKRPHAPDEALGAGTLEAGARRILAAGDGAQLEPRAPVRDATRDDT
jgi:hypothetical protein